MTTVKGNPEQPLDNSQNGIETLGFGSLFRALLSSEDKAPGLWSVVHMPHGDRKAAPRQEPDSL